MFPSAQWPRLLQPTAAYCIVLLFHHRYYFAVELVGGICICICICIYLYLYLYLSVPAFLVSTIRLCAPTGDEGRAHNRERRAPAQPGQAVDVGHPDVSKQHGGDRPSDRTSYDHAGTCTYHRLPLCDSSAAYPSIQSIAPN